MDNCNSTTKTASSKAAWDAAHPETRSTEARRSKNAVYYLANAEKIKARSRAYTAKLAELNKSQRCSVPKSAVLVVDRLRGLLGYDKDTGVFTNLVNRGNGASAGSRAGYLSPNGYLFISVDGISYRAHRLAWFYMYGVWPINEIDHINEVKTDNRIENLRDVTRNENEWNKSKPRIDGFTGARGVSKKRSFFESRITRNGVIYYLGIFKTLVEARDAYLSAKAEFVIKDVRPSPVVLLTTFD